SEMRERDDVTPLALEGLLLELIAVAERSARDENSAPAWLRRAIEHLHDDPRGAHSLRDLARFSGVHAGHFARAFRRHAGCTLGDYVRRIRVERAKEAIAAGCALADVADACGFADQSHFTRTFRRIAGVTPAAYRRFQNASGVQDARR
ncbi:MAG TPA: AraC family transcriptional regulator, partial [Thermoanaerobaculia bacterium]|nr:AraC family transcriptional regulator [Thermoanaerobaculia bacterium]